LGYAAADLELWKNMKITFSRKHWIANGVASILSLFCAITVICYSPFELPTRLALVALSIVVLLMCFYFWQPQEGGKESTGFWVWFTVFGAVWTFVGLWIGALIYQVPYFRLLTLHSAAWESLRWMGPLLIGPFIVLLGLVSIIRKGIPNLLNN
jgi:hypothetical protein